MNRSLTQVVIVGLVAIDVNIWGWSTGAGVYPLMLASFVAGMLVTMVMYHFIVERPVKKLDDRLRASVEEFAETLKKIEEQDD